MSSIEIPGKSGNSFLVLINNNITDKCQISHFGCRDHILVNRVVIKNTGTGIWAVNEFGTVVAHNGHGITDARKNTFTSAGKAGEEVSFDKTFGNKEGCFQCKLINNTIRAGWQCADFGIALRIVGIMHNDAVLEFFVECITKFVS